MDQSDWTCTTLDRSQKREMYDLWVSCFEDDPAIGYLFPSSRTRAFWLKFIFSYWTDFAFRKGTVTGLRPNLALPDQLAGMAMWFHPPFPPPWYGQILLGFRGLPILLSPRAFIRNYRFELLQKSLRPRKRDFAYLAVVCVCSKYRRQGLGKLLVANGLRHFQASGKRVFLHCWAPNKPFYERLGFEEFATGELRGIEEAHVGMLWEPSSS